MLRPRKRASSSSSSLLSMASATRTVPESGRSSPAMTISRVDLPDPDGPIRPTASPVPICKATSFRICTRPAPWPSERFTPASAIAGPARFLMPLFRWTLRSYGRAEVPLKLLAIVVLAMAMAWPALAADKPVRIVAFGDSLTAGLGLPAQEAFPAKLQAALKAKGLAANVVNAGVSGDTASAGLERLEWSVPDGTDGIILELGANDALRGLDPALTQKALNEILDKLAARRIPVLLAGMKAPRNLGSDYTARFDAIYPALASTHPVVFYPFFLEGVATDPHLNQGDGLHPNAPGVDVIVARILPQVEELIARAQAARGK